MVLAIEQNEKITYLDFLKQAPSIHLVSILFTKSTNKSLFSLSLIMQKFDTKKPFIGKFAASKNVIDEDLLCLCE